MSTVFGIVEVFSVVVFVFFAVTAVIGSKITLSLGIGALVEEPFFFGAGAYLQ